MTTTSLPFVPVPKGMCHGCRKPIVTRGRHCVSTACPWCANCGARVRAEATPPAPGEGAS